LIFKKKKMLTPRRFGLRAQNKFAQLQMNADKENDNQSENDEQQQLLLLANDDDDDDAVDMGCLLAGTNAMNMSQLYSKAGGMVGNGCLSMGSPALLKARGAASQNAMSERIKMKLLAAKSRQAQLEESLMNDSNDNDGEDAVAFAMSRPEDQLDENFDATTAIDDALFTPVKKPAAVTLVEDSLTPIFDQIAVPQQPTAASKAEQQALARRCFEHELRALTSTMRLETDMRALQESKTREIEQRGFEAEAKDKTIGLLRAQLAEVRQSEGASSARSTRMADELDEARSSLVAAEQRIESLRASLAASEERARAGEAAVATLAQSYFMAIALAIKFDMAVQNQPNVSLDQTVANTTHVQPLFERAQREGIGADSYPRWIAEQIGRAVEQQKMLDGERTKRSRTATRVVDEPRPMAAGTERRTKKQRYH
jgi:hypothetical protein